MAGKSWKDKACTLMSRRAAHSQQRLGEVLSDGEKIYRYTYGDPPVWHDPEAMREYLDRYSTEPEDERIQQGWITTMVPLHSVLRGVVLPFVMGGDAKWFNERRLDAGPLEAGRNELFARLSQRVWDECDAKNALYRALDDAFWARVGWVETDLDDRIDLPRHRWRNCRDVLVDVESRSPDHRDMRWMGVKQLIPIETAEWKASELWDASKYEFNPVTFEPYTHEDETISTEVVPGARRSETHPEIEAPTDFVRILRVFVKGENPHTESAKLSRKKMDDPAGHDAVYDGKDHVLIMEATAGYGAADAYKIIGRIDWPYPCDPGETPLTPVKLTRDNNDFYPYPITQPSHPLQVITNKALTAYYTDMRNSARRIFGVQPEAFQNEEDAQNILESDEALVGAMLKPGHNLEQAVQVKNFGNPVGSLNVGEELGRNLYRIVSGLQSFEVEVRANQTAFNTAIQNTQSQLKLHDLAEQPEHAAISMQRKALMCARANLNYEEILRWIIPPAGEDAEGRPFEREEITSRGKVQLVSSLWPTNPDWRDIRDEIAIDLEYRSMRFKNPDQQAAEVKELADYQTNMARIAMDTLKGGNSSGARAILMLMNNTVTMIAKLKNIPQWQDMILDPETIAPADPPQLDPNAVLDAETQAQIAAQQAAVNPQQEGAATRMQNQGVPPSGIPGALGGAA